MTTECYEARFLFANARGAPETQRTTNSRGLPGGCSRQELTRTCESELNIFSVNFVRLSIKGLLENGEVHHLF